MVIILLMYKQQYFCKSGIYWWFIFHIMGVTKMKIVYFKGLLKHRLHILAVFGLKPYIWSHILSASGTFEAIYFYGLRLLGISRSIFRLQVYIYTQT